MQITSYWQTETGYYDEKRGRYARRRHTDIQERQLEVVLKRSEYNNQPVLHFVGGPTGHETYYLNDILASLEEKSKGKWVICGGTINSWPRCWVTINDMKKAIKYFTEKEDKGENH